MIILSLDLVIRSIGLLQRLLPIASATLMPLASENRLSYGLDEPATVQNFRMKAMRIIGYLHRRPTQKILTDHCQKNSV